VQICKCANVFKLLDPVGLVAGYFGYGLTIGRQILINYPASQRTGLFWLRVVLWAVNRHTVNRQLFSRPSVNGQRSYNSCNLTAVRQVRAIRLNSCSQSGNMAFFLTKALDFPAPDMADEDGLLAFGGDLSTERLLLAYRSGIFPWYNEGDLIEWWCPDPRFVLLPQQLVVSKSMRPLLRKNTFDFTMNKAFPLVMENCRSIARNGQPGSWIQPEMITAYTQLHQMGHAISAEAWQDGQLVGGLYGVLLGKVFFGESMFSKVSNASKYAFIKLVEHLQQQGVVLIDCQMHTPHLESLGAAFIDRTRFLKCLKLYAVDK
jgi:leucyl/phenylalanyl-tRNA---protein transferase